MNFVRNTLALLALLIASAGPAPLWMHHALCHSHGSCSHSHHSLETAAAGSECCGHDHCSQTPATSEPSQAGAWQAGDHDCAICFQLSQASMLAGQSSDQSGTLLPAESFTFADTLFVPSVGGPSPPRGPPVSHT